MFQLYYWRLISKFVIHTYPFNGYAAVNITVYKNDEIFLQVSTQNNYEQEILKTFKCKYGVNGYRWSIIPLASLTYNGLIYTTSDVIDCAMYNVESTIEIFADVCL